MSDLQKTVEIIFGSRDELSPMFNSIDQQFENLTGKVRDDTAALANFTDTILKVDTALAALAIGGMAYAIKTAGEFSGKFGEISTLITETGAPVDAFKQQILDYSTQSVKSIDEINQAIYNAISAGVDYKSSIEFINAAEKLSVTGRANLADTTKVLISTLNAYGAGTDQATKYSDIMFTTVKMGQTTLTELSTQLSKVTGIAASSGVPFETLAAAIAALTVSGLPTEQALTGIKAALSNIVSPSSEATKLAAALGIQFNATALQTRGFEGVLWDAWRATGGNTEQMAKLFGSIEALNAVLILASDKTGKFKASLEATNQAAGIVQENYAKVVDEFGNLNTKLMNTITAMVVGVGEKLLPMYSQIVTSTGGISEGIRTAVTSGAFDPIFAYLTDFGKKVADILKQIGVNLPEAMKGLDFSGLIGSFDALGGALRNAFVAVFSDIDLTTVEGLHLAIQKIIDGMTALTNVTRGIIDGMQPLFAALGYAIEHFSEMDENTSSFIGTALGLAKTLNVVAENAGLMTAALSLFSGKIIIDIVLGLEALGVSVLALGGKITTMLSTIMLMNPMISYLGFALMAAALVSQTEIAQKCGEAFLDLLDVNDNFFGAQSRTKEEMAKVNLEFDAAVVKNRALRENLNQTATSFDTVKNSTYEFQFELQKIPEKKKVGIEVQADGSTIEQAYGLVIQRFPDDRPTTISTVEMTVDEWNLAAQKSKVSAAFPEKLPVEIQAKIDIAQIEASSKIVQASIEWKAKIDIAQIESATKIMEAMFGSLNTTIESTGTSMASMFGTLAEMQGMGTGLIERQIEEEARRRDEALRLQTELTEAQIDLLKQQVEAMKTGGAMIEIDGKGLQPHLEAFMFEILAAIQVKANAEGMKFLVGV